MSLREELAMPKAQPTGPFRLWLARSKPGDVFCDMVCLKETGTRAEMDAWVAKVYPHGIPGYAVIGRMTREQFINAWYS